MKRHSFSLSLLFLPLLLLFAGVADLHAQATQQLKNQANAGDPEAMVLLAQCYELGAGVELDTLQALQWYQRAMDKGNCEAALRMSLYHLRGDHMPADTMRCFQIRKEWADKGCADALSSLGNCYRNGYGVAPDTARFLSLVQQADKKGSVYAAVNLAYAYDYGFYGFKVDHKKAEKLLKKAYAKNKLYAGEVLMGFYIDNGNYAEAIKIGNELLPWGQPDVIQNWAKMYFYGYGVPLDEARAQRMMSDLVAKFHNLEFEQYYAGFVHLVPDNKELVDEQKALHYYHQGAARNVFYCMAALADYYSSKGNQDSAAYYYDRIITLNDKLYKSETGSTCLQYGYMEWQRGNEEHACQLFTLGMNNYANASCAMALASMEADKEQPDGEKIRQYYRKADQLGDTTALGELGRYYVMNGNTVAARTLFQEMVNKGNPEGYFWLGMLQDYEGSRMMALNTLEKGGKNGCTRCLLSLAEFYENGGEVNIPDYKRAASYYQKAGNDEALHKLGMYYLQGALGKQSKKDIAKGLGYLQKAADDGYIQSMYTLGEIYETGNYVDSVDHYKAVSYFRSLAQNNVPGGLFKMGLYHETGDGGVPYDTVKCVEYYRRAADMGYPLAWCYLGDFYRIGRFLPLDKEQAFKCYYMADSLGSATGCYYMGRSYLEGCGVEIDSAKAIPYLQVAAENGVGNAAYLMAEFYNYSKAGLTANGDSALAYYLSAHENGNGAASYFIAYHLLDEGAYEQAFQYAYTSLQRDNLDGAFLFAMMLQQGLGCEADPGSAYKIFEQLSRHYNDSRVYTQLGLARLQGNGCMDDMALGKTYLDTAAMLGNAAANYYLAACYLNGYGCEPDTAMAVNCLKTGSELGSSKAANLLGDIYQEQEQHDQAVQYYQKSADLGNLDGYCDMGYCYEHGLGVTLNSQKAYENYLYAAEHGSARGYMLLANCYVEGVYVEESDAKAQECYMKAAEMGVPKAMFYVGTIYEQGGKDVARDLKKAKEWYRKAAAAGYEPAEAALNRLK